MTASAVPFLRCGAYKHHVRLRLTILSSVGISHQLYALSARNNARHAAIFFEFQTQVSELTGMPVANASMYDGSTATAEAVLMAHRVKRKSRAVLSGRLHPHYTAVIENLSEMGGFAWHKPI